MIIRKQKGRFRGPFPEREHERILDGLDVLVLPSLWWENSPLSVLEARAAGLPVIASRTGGVPEIVPEDAGLLVPPGDAAALGIALGDVAEGRALSGAAPAAPLKTVAQEAHELARLYAELAGSRPQAARA